MSVPSANTRASRNVKSTASRPGIEPAGVEFPSESRPVSRNPARLRPNRPCGVYREEPL
jgi:hypothetical protein